MKRGQSPFSKHRVVVSFAANGPTQAQSFPRKRESTPQADGNAPPTDWIPAFAGITCQPTGFERDPIPIDTTTEQGIAQGLLEFTKQHRIPATSPLEKAYSSLGMAGLCDAGGRPAFFAGASPVDQDDHTLWAWAVGNATADCRRTEEEES